jgi:hypothetical protein
MTSYTLNSTDNVIDIRDVIERFEDLEGYCGGQDEFLNRYKELDRKHPSRRNAAEQEELRHMRICADEDETHELLKLSDLLEALKSNGGDEEWRGHWYPIDLIRETYFKKYMDDMLGDIGDIPKNLPSYLKIDVDYEALLMDYSEVYIDGITYCYR